MTTRVAGPFCCGLLLVLLARAPAAEPAATLPGTAPLTMEGDMASEMVAGIDRFLLRELEKSIQSRESYWKRDFSSPEAYTNSVERNRQRLAFILGVRDPRMPVDELELVSSTAKPALVGKGEGYEILAVRWPVLGNPRPPWTASAIIHGEGLLLRPTGRTALAGIVALPDADQTPEQLVGLAEGTPAEAQYARRLAESGCQVLVPALLSRRLEKRNGRANLTHREYIYRSAYELGRHVIGYEVQKVLAAVDWFSQEAGKGDAKIGLIGWGEGGMLALYAGAIDPRIDVVAVSGYFASRQDIWREPVDRNVFGLLEQFGDAEIASLVAPRPLVIETARGPELTLPGEGGAPGRLVSPPVDSVAAEVTRAERLVQDLPGGPFLHAIESGSDLPGTAETLNRFLALLNSTSKKETQAAVEQNVLQPLGAEPEPLGLAVDGALRERRQLEELDRFNQWLLDESPYVREAWFQRLDTSSPEKYAETIRPYREYYRDEVIGRFDLPRLPLAPRTRLLQDSAAWTAYEVAIDVFPDVFAYGVLLLPKNIAAGERRPVVVCQHGLEGRPNDTFQGNHRAYHDFAAKLAEEGFITFAPQNPYLFEDRFRTLQRKANPLKKTLFSVIVPQHEQIVAWLGSLPQVDARRIGFYGLSYGGKSAMRIPALVEEYSLSICSADFNDWVWKNASTRAPHSYVWTGEYEIFEFDLGSTFNYAEMAALIAPRPFMVERGHFDGVAPDERVGLEFAKIRHLYQARLGLGDRAEIEWFVGPHTIHGQGTFAFLRKHLGWKPSHPRP